MPRRKGAWTARSGAAAVHGKQPCVATHRRTESDRGQRRPQAGWRPPSALARPPVLRTDGWTAPQPVGRARGTAACLQCGGAVVPRDTPRRLGRLASRGCAAELYMFRPAIQKPAVCAGMSPWSVDHWRTCCLRYLDEDCLHGLIQSPCIEGAVCDSWHCGSLHEEAVIERCLRGSGSLYLQPVAYL